MWGAISRIGLLWGLAACGAQAPSRPPNIVVILADDLGYGDPGCYAADSKIPTPRMDAIAAAGMRFRDAHAPAAVCTPTRYGLLTGRYAWRTRLERGVLWGDSRLLIDPERTTLADVCRQAGYVTAVVGKWHLGLGEHEPVDYTRPLRPGPLELGFDAFFGIAATLDMPPYVWLRGDGVVQPASLYSAGSGLRRYGGAGFWRAGPQAVGFVHAEVLDRVTSEALAFLEARAAQPERPFFLFLSLTAPHTPWLPGEEFVGTSGAGPYGDFVAHVDACVGRVDQALERLGLEDSTLLLVTSDNGAHWTAEDIARYGHRANGPWRGQKGDIWEGGLRVPLLARWPGRVRAGAVSDDLVCLTDLFATCAALVGRELADDEGEDSFDFSPALLGSAPRGPRRSSLVLHSFAGHFALREGDLKLIPRHGSGGFTEPYERAPRPGEPPGALYDLARDPGETHNLWDESPGAVAHLRALLDEIQTTGRSRPRSTR